jgi:two-component system cell cycle response regulator DivK
MSEKITILYIEDNPQNTRLIQRMLSVKDYHVIAAFNGMTGLQLAESERPDLILMDINLPDIEGTEIVKRLKANERLAHIPVIALTANAMHGDRERFLEHGCDGYIAKPVSRTELLNTVAIFLDRRNSNSTNSNSTS